jgi:hypothetical protein
VRAENVRMTIEEARSILLWCVGIHYAVLLTWFAVFVSAHDWLHALHSRWFRLSVEAFDTVHYAGMALHKIGILLFFLVPWVALGAAS